MSKLITAFKLFADYGIEGICDRVREKVTKIHTWTNDVCFPPQLIKTNEYTHLNVPQFESITVSIVIPVYNQFKFTYNCIKSIVNSVIDVSYEIIIGDDLSSDETSRINDFISGIIINRNEIDHGFLMNCNNAAKKAHGKYICFLNNDTQVQRNWLESLIELIEKDNTIGLVGSKLIFPNGMLQEAGGIIFQDGSGFNYGRNDSPYSSEYNYVKEVDYISGASILIKKELWQRIGGFDERFKPAYYEDTDLAFEVRKLGFKVMYQPKSEVVHFEGISNGKDLNSGLKRYQVKNQKKFADKWHNELKSQYLPKDNVFLARERHTGKRILVFDSTIPFFDKNAGNRCTYMYIKIFLQLGLKVTFVSDDFHLSEPYFSILTQQGVEILYGSNYHNNIRFWLKDHLKYFNFVYLQRPYTSIKYIDILFRHFKGKIFYFAHDLHYLRFYREYKITHEKTFLVESEKVKKIENKLFSKVDVIHVVGSAEEELLKKQFPKKVVRNIPLYIYENRVNDVEKDFSKRHGILFVGGFAHHPNVDAVKYFSEDIFPKIVKNIPNVVWHIVGSNCPEEIKSLESKNIKIEGFCSDEKLTSLYQTCRMAVVPLRYGAGVKGKIVESAYQQLPLITTSIGAEGLDSSFGCFLEEDDNEKLADLIINTYFDYELLKKMSNAGAHFIEKYFSPEVAKSILLQDMQEN